MQLKILLKQHIEDSLILSLSEVKQFLRITYDEDDNLLYSLIDSVVEYAENFMNINIKQKKFYVKFMNIDKLEIYFNELPVTKITNIRIVDSSNKILENLIGNHDYSLINNTKLLLLNENILKKDIEINCILGYEVRTLPRSIKQALLDHISMIYENGCISESLQYIHNAYFQFKNFLL